MYEINTNIILVFYKMRFYLCNMFTLTQITTERRAAKANCLRGGVFTYLIFIEDSGKYDIM